MSLTLLEFAGSESVCVFPGTGVGHVLESGCFPSPRELLRVPKALQQEAEA